ncbi:MAG: cytochrome c [Cyclobacteriaceae bacterium]
MKSSVLILAIVIFALYACSSDKKAPENTNISEEKSLVGHVDLTDPLDGQLIEQGMKIFTSKCTRCHTLDTAEFIVPALAGVTNRRSPEWIMNMIINVDEMLKQDPVAADLLRRHKKVMPDPMLSVTETRAILEFLRKNDLEQSGEKDKGVEE